MGWLPSSTKIISNGFKIDAIFMFLSVKVYINVKNFKY